MNRHFLLAGLLVLGLYGCGAKPTPVTTPTTVASTTDPATGQPKSLDDRLHEPVATHPDTDPAVPPASTSTPAAPAKVPAAPMSAAEVKNTEKLRTEEGQAPLDTAALGWSPSTMTASDLAKQTDQAMSWLKGAMAKVSVAFENAGGHGTSECKVAIKTSKIFNIEYPALSELKYHEVSKEAVIADGADLGWFALGKGLYKEEPLGSSHYPDDAPLSDWPYKFPKLLFSTLRGGHPLEALVLDANRPGSGMKVSLQERKFDYKGKIVRQKLLTIEKQHDGGAPLTIEIMIDFDHLLPVSVATAIGSIGKKPTQVLWTAGWGYPPASILDEQSFKMPPAGASNTTKTSQ